MIRKFIPGTEWLYLKIYTGIKTSDIILEEVIEPLVKDLQAGKYISKWFFIRYHDPESHLRIRFCLNDIKDYIFVLNRINKGLSEFLESWEISSIISDTYVREMERYGEKSITEAETLFHKNSNFTLQCLTYDDEEKIMLSMFLIDRTLHQLNITMNQRFDWIKNSNVAFKEEFNADKRLNSQLDKKYRLFKIKYIEFLESEDFSEVRETVNFHVKQSVPVLQRIIRIHQDYSSGISLQNFFQSIFHMNINRLFVSSQRLFEMVIYDFMMRYYKMKIYDSSKIHLINRSLS